MDNIKMDSSQYQQQYLAMGWGIKDSEILKHPEWSGLFMNIVVNKEKEGKDLKSCFLAAEWLSNNLTDEAKETGKIGDNYEILFLLLKIIDKGITPKDFGDIPKNKEIECRYNLLTQLLEVNKALTLSSGRYSVRDLRTDEIQLLLSEGNLSVYNLLGQLQSLNSDKGFYDSTNVAWNKSIILLTLDDMNIRGVQLLDALEYASNSIVELVDILNKRGRGTDFLAYINNQSALRIKNGESFKEYIAVDGGASFTVDPLYVLDSPNNEYLMSEFNYSKYLSTKLLCKSSINWLSKDVTSNVGRNEGLEICKSRGFEVVLSFMHRGYNERDYESLLLYNKNTGDLIFIDGATEDKLCYAGCELFVCRKERCHSFCTSGWDDKLNGFYHKFSHQNGLFKDWDFNCKSTSCLKQGIDISNLGWGIGGVPKLRLFYVGYIRDEKFKAQVRDFSFDVSKTSYELESLVSYVILYCMVDTISDKVPAYIRYKDWFLNNCLADSLIWSGYDIIGNLQLFKVLIDYVKLPKNIVDSMLAGVKSKLAAYDAREIERLGGKLKAMTKGYHLAEKSFDKNINILNEYSETANIIKVLGLPDINSLSVKFEWLK